MIHTFNDSANLKEFILYCMNFSRINSGINLGRIIESEFWSPLWVFSVVYILIFVISFVFDFLYPMFVHHHP